MQSAIIQRPLPLLLSIFIHIFIFWPGLTKKTAPPNAQRIEARLLSEVMPAIKTEVPLKFNPPEPEMQRPESSKPRPPKPQSPSPTPKTEAKTISWQQQIKQHLKKLQQTGQFYPLEAIAQGMEGEVLIFMVLDAQGQVGAARVEQSSGYALLDQAALRAIRSLSSLPAETPREVILPVRFRLR